MDELAEQSVSEDVVCQDGKRYGRISNEEAFRIRFDVQLYYYYRVEDRIREDFDTPESYRRKSSEDPSYASAATLWWKERPFYVEVAPNREEYVCG